MLVVFLFGDAHFNTSPIKPYCRIMYTKMHGLKDNLHDLPVTLINHDVICCSETLVSDMRHVAEPFIPNFGKPLLIRHMSVLKTQGMCFYMFSV